MEQPPFPPNNKHIVYGMPLSVYHTNVSKYAAINEVKMNLYKSSYVNHFAADCTDSRFFRENRYNP